MALWIYFTVLALTLAASSVAAQTLVTTTKQFQSMDAVFQATVTPANISKSVALYPVQVKGKWGFIDEAGKLVVEMKYDESYDFSEGVAMIRIAEKRGYIDKTGKIIWEPSN